MKYTDKMKDISLKNMIIIVTYIALLVLGVLYIEEVLETISQLMGILKPFILGFIFAFVFNIPMKQFEKRLKIKDEKRKKALSGLLSIILVLSLLIIVVLIVIPQVVDNIVMFVEQLPSRIETTMIWLDKILIQFDLSSEIIFADILKELEGLQQVDMNTILTKITELMPGIASKVTHFTTNVVDVFMGLVMAIYMVFSKDVLLRQVRRLTKAVFDDKKYEYLLDVAHLSSQTFENFFAGQLLEAIIIGVLCYIGCLALGIPYASLAGIIIGITNVIPIFGPIIGAVISGVLILLVSPMKALIFVVFSVILQQVESNLIYPRVVGGSIGLSALWVLFAVTVSGGLFGITGMIFGLPAFSVVYELLRRWTNKRLKEKEPVQKVEVEELGN